MINKIKDIMSKKGKSSEKENLEALEDQILDTQEKSEENEGN